MDRVQLAVRIPASLQEQLNSYLQRDMGSISQLRNAMFDDDILIAEMKLRSKYSSGIEGREELNKQFDFTPLYELCVPYDPARLRYEERYSRSQVRGTVTTTAVYDGFQLDGNRIESAELSYIHEYDQDALTEAIEGEGFSILGHFSNNSTIIYVLKK